MAAGWICLELVFIIPSRFLEPFQLLGVVKASSQLRSLSAISVSLHLLLQSPKNHPAIPAPNQKSLRSGVVRDPLTVVSHAGAPATPPRPRLELETLAGTGTVRIRTGGRRKTPSVAALPVHRVREIGSARRSPRLAVARQVHHHPRQPQVLAQVQVPIPLTAPGSLARARRSPRSRVTRPESANFLHRFVPFPDHPP